MNKYQIITEKGEIIPIHGVEGEAGFQHYNSAFKFDTYDGAYVLGLKCPTEGNEKAFGYAHRLEIIAHSNIYRAEMLVDDNTIYKGLISIDSSELENRSGSFEFDFSVTDFVYAIKDLTIKDVCNEVVSLRLTPDDADLRPAVEALNTLNWPSVPVYFPVMNNEGFYGSANEVFLGTINPWDSITQEFLAASEINEGGDAYDTRFTFVPSVYTLEILKRIGEHVNYKVRGTVMDDPAMYRWLTVGGLSLDEVSNPDLVSISRNEVIDTVLDNNETDLYIGWNAVEPDNTSDDINIALDEPWIIPDTDTRTASFNLKIQGIPTSDGPAWGTVRVHIKTNGTTGTGGEQTYNQFGAGEVNLDLNIEFTPLPADVGESMGVYIEVIDLFDMDIELRNAELKIKRQVDETLNLGLEEFRVGDTLPPTPIDKFLMAVKNTWGINLHIDSRKKEINLNYAADALKKEPIAIDSARVVSRFKKIPKDTESYKLTWGDDVVEPERFRGRYTTYADLPVGRLYQTAFVINESAYYEFIFDEDAQNTIWVRKKGITDYYIAGDSTAEPVEIKPDVKIPEMNRLRLGPEPLDSAEYLLPMVSFEGASQMFGMPSKTSHDLMWLFKAGWQTADNGGGYPMATTTEFNYGGNLILPAPLVRTLQWNGSYGLKNKYWAQWLNILVNTEQIELDVQLPAHLEEGQDINAPLLINNVVLLPSEQTLNHSSPDAPATLVTRKIQGI